MTRINQVIQRLRDNTFEVYDTDPDSDVFAREDVIMIQTGNTLIIHTPEKTILQIGDALIIS